MTEIEDKTYKHHDYGFRASDPYAFRKYMILMKWLPDADSLRILNAGCGSGEMNWLLATRNPTWRVDAIDIDVHAVQLSQELKARYNLQNLQVHESSIEDFQAAAPYDVIVSNDVLEHIDDVRNAVRCLNGLIKPRGKLYISVPALQWLFGYHDVLLGHYRRYNRRLIREHFDGYFDIEHMRYFGALLIPIALWFSRIRNRPYPLKSQENKESLAARIVNTILNIEEHVNLHTGTSLLVSAHAVDQTGSTNGTHSL